MSDTAIIRRTPLTENLLRLGLLTESQLEPLTPLMIFQRNVEMAAEVDRVNAALIEKHGPGAQQI